jgi:pimeloyl-ACP methyl ester carboxylesterase
VSEPFAESIPEVDGVRHYYANAGGLRVHVAEAGPPDAEPVLLLHGWPQHWYEWRGLVPHLSPRYRMIMPDLRGLGWTEVTKGGYEKENLARDQIALLDELGIDKVKLIGHDWGGYAGFLICLLWPERVERYLATNIIHPWPRPSARGLLDLWRVSYQLPMVLPFIGPRVTRKRGFVRSFMNGSKKGVFTDDELEAFEAPLRDPARSPATAGYYRSFQRHDFPLLLRRHWTKYRLTVPTLMLHGGGDFALPPASVEGFEPYADDMRLESIPDTGHFIVDAVPDLVARKALELFEAR